jgi:hypothetical protein
MVIGVASDGEMPKDSILNIRPAPVDKWVTLRPGQAIEFSLSARLPKCQTVTVMGVKEVLE